MKALADRRPSATRRTTAARSLPRDGERNASCPAPSQPERAPMGHACSDTNPETTAARDASAAALATGELDIDLETNMTNSHEAKSEAAAKTGRALENDTGGAEAAAPVHSETSRCGAPGAWTSGGARLEHGRRSSRRTGKSRRPTTGGPSAPDCPSPAGLAARCLRGGFARALALLALAFAAFVPAPLPAFAQEEVPFEWPLKPDGVGRGETFRLMFVSTNTRGGGSSIISNYNNVVRTAADNGHPALDPYKNDFNAVASTSSRDARDNTDTNPNSDGAGEPIYRVGGDKIADNHADFYDGRSHLRGDVS